jgi:zinc transporter, ZIP family
MIWSSLLGGLSQPIGAGIAALVFKLAQGGHEPGDLVYGGMFALTGMFFLFSCSLFIIIRPRPSSRREKRANVRCW